MTTIRETERLWWKEWIRQRKADRYEIACDHAKAEAENGERVVYFYTGGEVYCGACADEHIGAYTMDRCARCDCDITKGALRKIEVGPTNSLVFELCELCNLTLIEETE